MKIIKHFDIFAKNYLLNFKGKKKFQTKFGVINTICFSILAFLTIGFIGQSLIYKNNPKIVKQVENLINPKFLKLNGKFFFAVGIYSNLLRKVFYDESIFELEVYFIRKSISVGKPIKLDRIKSKLVLCNASHISHLQNVSEISEKTLKNYFCFENDINYQIFGTFDMDFYEGIDLYFKRCTNSSKCSSIETIEKVLSKAWIMIKTVDSTLNPKNFANPTYLRYNFYERTFSSKNLLNLRVPISENRIVSDSGIIFENLLYDYYLESKEIEFYMNERVKETFAFIYIETTRTLKTTFRSYEKIPSIIAQAGGIISFIQFFYKLIVSPITNILMVKDVINSKYFLKKKKNENKLKKKKNNKKKKIKKEEGEINEIKELQVIDLISKTSNSNILKRLCLNSVSFLKYFFCKRYKKEKKGMIVKSILKEFKNHFCIENYYCKIKEIDLMKKILFDKNQRLFIKYYPKFILKIEKERKKKTSENVFNNSLKLIEDKTIKNAIDKNILKFVMKTSNIKDLK